MAFSETYRAERLIDRRSRGRKARIAGRIIGFVLAACLIVAVRTDPNLRAMVDDAALAVISGAMPNENQDAVSAADAGARATLDGDPAAVPSAQHMPQSRVKIHRGGITKD